MAILEQGPDIAGDFTQDAQPDPLPPDSDHLVPGRQLEDDARAVYGSDPADSQVSVSSGLLNEADDDLSRQADPEPAVATQAPEEAAPAQPEADRLTAGPPAAAEAEGPGMTAGSPAHLSPAEYPTPPPDASGSAELGHMALTAQQGDAQAESSEPAPVDNSPASAALLPEQTSAEALGQPSGDAEQSLPATVATAERSEALPSPFAEASPRHTTERLAYRLWLPDGQRTGRIEAFSECGPDAVRFLPSYIEGSEREIKELNELAAGGMRDPLEAIGYSVVYDQPTRTGHATYASSEYLATRFTEPPQENELGLPAFRVFPGGRYTGLESIGALAEGYVLLSDSTRLHTQYPTDYIDEKYTLMGHDMLVHAPAWLCLPPPVVARVQAAAQRAITAYRTAEVDSPAQATALKRIGRMTHLIDTNIYTLPFSHIVETEGQTRNNHVGERLRELIGDDDPEPRSAADYEEDIYQYTQNPAALRSGLAATNHIPNPVLLLAA